MERNVTNSRNYFPSSHCIPKLCDCMTSYVTLFLGNSFVLLYLYVMCNYQGEIFAINEAEFKISAATLWNLKIIESIFSPPLA